MFDPYIKAHARHRPHAVAVSSLQDDVTFGRFDAEIDSVAAAILDAGLGETQLAAVEVANAYVHWLILLALCRLRIASATVGALGATKTVALLDADLLITDQTEEGHAQSVLRATPEWIGQVLQQGLKPTFPIVCNPDALARVTLSSGTSGTPRMIARTWRELETYVRVGSLLTFCMMNEPVSQRVLSMLGMDTIAYYGALSTWLSGGTLILVTAGQSIELNLLRQLRPTIMLAAPIQMEAIASQLSDDFLPFPNLTLITGGSHLSASLSRTLRLRLTANVWNFYGSSEAGMVARGQVARLSEDHSAAGWLEPEAQVQVVDDDDRLLPPGEIGNIRVKTTMMASGYFRNELATKEHFREGWFYSGDAGSLSTGGLLRIIGRSDEVVNIGGVKFLPRVLEDAVLSCKGVRDAAAFTLSNDTDAPVPWLAIVRGEDLNESDIAEALNSLRLPPVHVGWVEQIPRNERGKVQLDRLMAAAQAHQTRPKP